MKAPPLIILAFINKLVVFSLSFISLSLISLLLISSLLISSLLISIILKNLSGRLIEQNLFLLLFGIGIGGDCVLLYLIERY